MTVLARNSGVLQAADHSISIIASPPAMPLNILLSGQLGTEHFSIHVTLIGSGPLPTGPKLREGGSEPRKPESDTDTDEYGENGERMPYYPARPRELCSGASFPGRLAEIARGGRVR